MTADKSFNLNVSMESDVVGLYYSVRPLNIPEGIEDLSEIFGFDDDTYDLLEAASKGKKIDIEDRFTDFDYSFYESFGFAEGTSSPDVTLVEGIVRTSSLDQTVIIDTDDSDNDYNVCDNINQLDIYPVEWTKVPDSQSIAALQSQRVDYQNDFDLNTLLKVVKDEGLTQGKSVLNENDNYVEALESSQRLRKPGLYCCLYEIRENYGSGIEYEIDGKFDENKLSLRTHRFIIGADPDNLQPISPLNFELESFFYDGDILQHPVMLPDERKELHAFQFFIFRIDEDHNVSIEAKLIKNDTFDIRPEFLSELQKVFFGN